MQLRRDDKHKEATAGRPPRNKRLTGNASSRRHQLLNRQSTTWGQRGSGKRVRPRSDSSRRAKRRRRQQGAKGAPCGIETSDALLGPKGEVGQVELKGRHEEKCKGWQAKHKGDREESKLDKKFSGNTGKSKSDQQLEVASANPLNVQK